MTETSAPDEGHKQPTLKELASAASVTSGQNVQPLGDTSEQMGGGDAGPADTEQGRASLHKMKSLVSCVGQRYTPLYCRNSKCVICGPQFDIFVQRV